METVLVVGSLALVSFVGACIVSFLLSQPQPLATTRRLALAEPFAWLVPMILLAILSPGTGLKVFLGLAWLATLPLSFTLSRYCTECGHRERWSRPFEAPTFCSYDNAPLAKLRELPRETFVPDVGPAPKAKRRAL